MGRPVLLLELLSQGVETTLVPFPEPLRDAVERLDQDLGVPEAAQAPGDLAVVVVLPPPDVVSDLVPDQA